MMQTPPIPPGFTTTPPQGLPPIPQGFSARPPQQAQNPARPAPSRLPAPQPRPAPINQPQQAPLNDLGISTPEEIETLIRQGYSMQDAQAFASQGETANTPAQEPTVVEIDQGVYQPGLNTNESYLDAIKAGTPSQGYLTARSQEEARSKLLRDSGVGMTMADQFTAPLNDELSGAVGYLSQGAGNLGRRLMGRDIEVSAADRARAATDTARNDQERFQRENPLQAATGQVLGGFAFAPSRVAGLASGAQNFLRTSQAFARPTIAQGYGAAAATGAGYGLAESEGGLPGRALGTGLGALGGVVTAGLIDGGANLVSRIGNRAPAGHNRVGSIIERELRSNRVDPQDVLSGLNSAPRGALPFNVADNALAPVAEVLASNPGPGGVRVQQAVRNQRTDSGNRIMDRVGTEMGGRGDYLSTLGGVIDTRRQAANQVIEQIGPQQFRLNDNAVRSLRSDLAQGEVRSAAQNALSSPDQQTYEMGANLMRLADTLRDNPSAAVLDVRTAQDVSKALLDRSSDAWRRGDGSQGQALGGIGRAVRNNARESVPEYGDWLRRYGDESSQIEALELGRRVFRNADDPSIDGMSAEALRSQFNDMSDTAKDMFRKGVAEAVVARTRTSRGGVGAMRDLVKTQEFADRVRIAFPDEQAFERFLSGAEGEVILANVGNNITGNSRTAPRQAAARRLGAQDVQQGADQLSQATLTGIPLAAGRAGIRAIGRRLGRNNSVLENDQLNDLLGQAITEPDLLRQLLTRPTRGLIGVRQPAGVVGAAPQLLPGY